MLNIGGGELLIILLLALVVLGPERLPGVARQLGQTVSGLRAMASGFQAEMDAAAKQTQDSMTLEGPTDRAEAIKKTQTDPAKIAEAARSIDHDADVPAVSGGGPQDLSESEAAIMATDSVQGDRATESDDSVTSSDGDDDDDWAEESVEHDAAVPGPTALVEEEE